MREENRKYILKYTGLFALMSLLVFLPFLIEGRSFVCKVDGQSQYIVYLRYMGQYLRSWAGGILKGNFVPPQYDFSIGIGDDINAIVRFHPLDFLAAFFPSSMAEPLYAVILLLRFYLAGLAFSAYAFYWNTVPVSGEREARVLVHPLNVLSGSLVYLFGGFMLIRVTNHPTYAAPFIILPLLLLGAEHVLHGAGFLLFPLMVMLGFWSNYYFMYIISVGLLVYMLIRFFETCPAGSPGARIRSFFTLAVKMIALYILGLCMSMATLLPTVFRYLSSARLSQTSVTKNLLIYEDKLRYGAWFLNLVSPFRSSGNGTDLNFAVTVLPACALLFALSWKKLRSLKLTLIAELVFLLVPAGGYIMAGFNNENNRWIFLIAMSLGMALVFVADGFQKLSDRQSSVLILTTVLFCIAAVVQDILLGFNVYNTVGALELFGAAAVLLYISGKRLPVRKVRYAVLLLTAVSTAVNAVFTFASPFGAVASDFTKAGQSLAKYENYAPASASYEAYQTADDPLDRTDVWCMEHNYENSGEYFGYSGISIYNSIMNAGLMDAMSSQNNIGLDAVTQIHGLGGRPVAEALGHVRYFAAPSDETEAVPYGFSRQPLLTKDGISVYESEHMLSEGCSYDSFIRRENYDKLTDLERELVQLHAVVLDDERDGGIGRSGKAGGDKGNGTGNANTEKDMNGTGNASTEKDVNGNADVNAGKDGNGKGNNLADTLLAAGLQELTGTPEEILTVDIVLPEAGEDVRRTKKGYNVEEKNGRIAFDVEKKAGYTTYLRLKDLHFEEEYCRLGLSMNGLSYETTLRNERQVYNVGRTDYLFCLGFSEEDTVKTVSLNFFAKGKYKLGSISVEYVPMADFDKNIDALNEESLENAEISGDVMRGNISLSKARFVVFPLAESDGWSLTVDGEKTALQKANLAYMGALIPAGEHEICLRYQSRGLAAGAAIAACAILIWLLLALYSKKKKKGNA